MVRTASAVVVGAGMGGLAAAVDLAAAGVDVTVVERGEAPGGKMRVARLLDRAIDVGPTVLTMKWVFEELFADAGARLEDHVALEQAEVLARHVWPDGTMLDLFADRRRSVDAIGRVFGAREAAAFEAFSLEAQRIYETVERPFLRSQAPTAMGMVGHLASLGMGALFRIDAHRTMASALERRFADPRLRQLFGRYATYCGSSPYEAPATFNLVAHVEAMGVHRVRGGMAALARAIEGLARSLGVSFRYGETVTRVIVERGRACGVALASGEELRAQTVVFNGDVSAVAALLDDGDRAPSPTPADRRSLSAVTWAMVAHADRFPLLHHNVFFSSDYAAENDDILRRGRAPEEPTIYVCAQDRGDAPIQIAGERMLLIMNAPATGDDPSRWTETERRRCDRAAKTTLSRCGFLLRPDVEVMTTPVELDEAYPATGGALYGPIARGATSTLARKGAKTRIPGLYLAGGSVHPGPGLPLAASSGRRAAEAVIEDLAKLSKSTARGSIDSSRMVDTSGTTSMS